MFPNVSGARGGGGTLGDEFMGLSFGKRFREMTLTDGAIDEIRVYAKALTPIEVRYLQAETVPATAGLRTDLVELLVARDARVSDAAAKLAEARQAQNLVISVVPEIPVMGDTPTPRPTYVLLRGQYTDHGEQVQPRGLSQVFAWDSTLPPNRIGLAKWLFDPENPLTSRVFVNRLWQMHLGRGLVETSEDFGAQGSVLTHRRVRLGRQADAPYDRQVCDVSTAVSRWPGDRCRTPRSRRSRS
jgi:hypothetical protein